MRKTFVVIFCAGLLFLTSSPDAEMLIRVHNPLPDELPRGLDVAGSRRGEWIDVVADEKDIGDFAHLEFEILIEDVESFYASRKGEYHSYPDVVDHLQLIAAVYSDIAMLDTIGTTWDGREILALKISDNVGVDESEPEVLFVGLHHAREWPSLEICLFQS